MDNVKFGLIVNSKRNISDKRGLSYIYKGQSLILCSDQTQRKLFTGLNFIQSDETQLQYHLCH